MELIIDDLLSKLDEGIKRGFSLQGFKNSKKNKKKDSSPNN
jgi:hypothetical protein